MPIQITFLMVSAVAWNSHQIIKTSHELVNYIIGNSTNEYLDLYFELDKFMQ